MGLNEQQKKQTLTLLILIGVLGAVFYYADPFGLFETVSEFPPELKKNLEDNKKRSAEAAKENKKTTPIEPVVTDKPKKPLPNLHDAPDDFTVLIPEVPVLDAAKLINNKTAYKVNIFMHKVDIGGGIKTIPLPKVVSHTSLGGENKVKFNNVINPSDGKPTIKFLKKGDEFIFNKIKYRILDITLVYNPENRSRGVVLIMDDSDQASRFNEYEIFIK